MGVRGVTDLMVAPGLVNLDFADIRTVMAEMGKAMMGTGEAEGENRAIRAAEAAISNPLLEDTSMAGARGLLINITGGEDMTLFEVDQAANRIREEVAEDANIIFGSAIDENLSGRVRVSVVATGIDMGQTEAQKPRLVAVGGAGMTHAVAAAPAGPAPSLMPPSFGMLGQPAAPLVPAQLLTPRAAEMAAEAASHSDAQQARPQRYASPAPAQQPASAPRAGSADPSRTESAHPAGAPSSTRSLFDIMTGIGRIRRVAVLDTEPQRAEPSFPGQAASAAPRQEPVDEGLDIPTFLRRQKS